MVIRKIREMLYARKNRETIYCTANYWDWKAEVHQGEAISMWPNNYLNYYYHQEQLTWFEQYLPQVNGAKVLDVGCGTGRISRYLVKRGANVVGIDFSSKAIALAQHKSPPGNPCYRVQSIFDLDEKQNFDIVVCWGALTVACKNRFELLDVMKRLHEALKPEGKIVLLEPIHRGFLHRVLNLDIHEFCQVMNEAGFQVDRVSHLHFWPVRLALSYVPWPKFITATGYYAGELVMKALGNRAFGDYKTILATLKNSTSLS